MKLIEINNITKRYEMGDNVVMALQDVSLSIEAGEYLSSMFGLSGKALYSGYDSYILSSNAVLLILCFFFLTSVGSHLLRHLRKKFPNLYDVGSVVYHVGLLAVSVSLIL